MPTRHIPEAHVEKVFRMTATIASEKSTSDL